MIIYIIFLLIIAVITSWTLISKPVLRTTLGLTFSVLLLLSTSILTLSFSDHYGMKQVTTTETKQIYSATKKSPAGILIYKQLGTKADRYVLIYSDTNKGKAKVHFKPDTKNVISAVKKDATYQTAEVKQATLKTKTTKWQWKNNTAKTWLNIDNQDNELIRQRNIVTIPKKTWLAISANQAEKLKKILASDKSNQSNAEITNSLSQEQLAELTVQKLKEALQ